MEERSDFDVFDLSDTSKEMFSNTSTKDSCSFLNSADKYLMFGNYQNFEHTDLFCSRPFLNNILQVEDKIDFSPDFGEMPITKEKALPFEKFNFDYDDAAENLDIPVNDKNITNGLNPPPFSKYKSHVHDEFDQFKLPNILDLNKNYFKIHVKRMFKQPKENKITENSPPNPVVFKLTQNGDCQITKAVLQTTTNQIRGFLKSFHLNGIDWYDAYLEIEEDGSGCTLNKYKIVFQELSKDIQSIINRNIILTSCDIMYPGTFSPSLISLLGFLESNLVIDLNLKAHDNCEVSESSKIKEARNQIVKTKKSYRNKISTFEFDIPCNMNYNYVRFVSNNEFKSQEFTYKLESYMFAHQKTFHRVKPVNKTAHTTRQRTRKGNAKKRSKSKTTLEHEESLRLKNQLKLCSKINVEDQLLEDNFSAHKKPLQLEIYLDPGSTLPKESDYDFMDFEFQNFLAHQNM